MRAWDREKNSSSRPSQSQGLQSIISLHAVIYLTLGLCLHALFVFPCPLVCVSLTFSLAYCACGLASGGKKIVWGKIGFLACVINFHIGMKLSQE